MKKQAEKQPEKRRRVALVGLTNTADFAPWDDDTFEWWTLNQGVRCFKGKHIDMYFDLHDWVSANYEPDYLPLVSELKCKVVTPDNYPYEKVWARYGAFLENSFPMMLYYAGLEDVKDIYIFGVNDGEFSDDKRAGWALYHAMGALRAEGRHVYLCNQYAMDYSGIYGFDNLQKTRLPQGFAFKERGVSYMPAVWPNRKLM